MRTRFIASLALVMSLLLVVIASEADAGYISSVEIHVDGFICATCVRQIERALKVEGGVAQVTGNWEEGIVAVIPDQEIGWVDLLDIRSRVNGTRNYSVLKMDVVAVGTVTKYPVEYYVGGLYAYSGDRYILKIHDARKRHFILAQNEKLDKLIEAGHKAARLTGTITAFSREKVPIMEIREFQSLDKEEETKVIESYEVSPDVIPDQIVAVDIHVDGYICATCVRALKRNLLTEEGVAAIDVDLETGVIKVIPALDEETIDPFYLRKRINSSRDEFRDLDVSRMDIEAIGTVVKFPVRYSVAREYTHSHDRYKLQVGDKFFILAEDRKLQQLIDSGLKRVRLKGKILSMRAGRSILAIGAFQPVGAGDEMVGYDDPMADFAASSAERKELLEKAGHAHIESIRVYVDGFICAVCDRPLKETVLAEESVNIVNIDAEAGLIELVPKEGEPFDLLDIEQRINAMREYKVLKIDIVASGKIEEVEMGYREDSAHMEKNTRYTLSAGKSGSLLLSENDKLSEMLKSGNKAFSVVGTVAAFWGNTPILAISDYKKLEEYPEWLK